MSSRWHASWMLIWALAAGAVIISGMTWAWEARDPFFCIGLAYAALSIKHYWQGDKCTPAKNCGSHVPGDWGDT